MTPKPRINDRDGIRTSLLGGLALVTHPPWPHASTHTLKHQIETRMLGKDLIPGLAREMRMFIRVVALVRVY